MYSQIIDNQNKALLEKEQENAELKDKLKNLASVAEVRLANWQKYKKENAELKNKYDTCLRENTGLRTPNTYIEKKNTQAKEIIKLLLWDLRNRSYEPLKDIERAEQFLKESE